MRRALGPMLCLFLGACGGYEMENQKKYEPYEASAFFPDGSVAQRPVEGTVFRGELELLAVLGRRPEMTQELLAYGRERFNIFCSPCHGQSGHGNGLITQRGFPNPPSFHVERLRQAPATYFLNVIRDGYGVMYSYAYRVPPADRWAIVAYIRALQLSQHAIAGGLPEPVLESLLETES